MSLYSEAIAEATKAWIESIQAFLMESFDLKPDREEIRRRFEELLNARDPATSATLEQEFVSAFGEDELDKQVGYRLRALRGT